MPNINIYLPRKYEKLLEEKMGDGETMGGTAKRLLLGLLDGGESGIDPIYNTSLKEIESRLESLEEISDRLEKLEMKFGAIEGRGASDNSEIDRQSERLTEIQDRLTDLVDDMGFSADDLDKLTHDIKERVLDSIGTRFTILESWVKSLQQDQNILANRIPLDPDPFSETEATPEAPAKTTRSRAKK